MCQLNPFYLFYANIQLYQPLLVSTTRFQLPNFIVKFCKASYPFPFAGFCSSSSLAVLFYGRVKLKRCNTTLEFVISLRTSISFLLLLRPTQFFIDQWLSIGCCIIYRRIFVLRYRQVILHLLFCFNISAVESGLLVTTFFYVEFYLMCIMI